MVLPTWKKISEIGNFPQDFQLLFFTYNILSLKFKDSKIMAKKIKELIFTMLMERDAQMLEHLKLQWNNGDHDI